jgi:hypothetical protein
MGGMLPRGVSRKFELPLPAPRIGRGIALEVLDMIRRSALATCLALALTAPLAAQTPWIHVEVDEGGGGDAHVKVNLPLSVVEVVLAAAPEKILNKGRIHLHGDEDIDVQELRRAWSELRKSGDAELVTVENHGATVSVRREGEHVLVDVDERTAGDTVHVRVPVAVVDALFSGEGEELNVKDAIAELGSLRGDVVRVDDGESKVRIWIDEKD